MLGFAKFSATVAPEKMFARETWKSLLYRAANLPRTPNPLGSTLAPTSFKRAEKGTFKTSIHVQGGFTLALRESGLGGSVRSGKNFRDGAVLNVLIRSLPRLNLPEQFATSGNSAGLNAGSHLAEPIVFGLVENAGLRFQTWATGSHFAQPVILGLALHLHLSEVVGFCEGQQACHDIQTALWIGLAFCCGRVAQDVAGAGEQRLIKAPRIKLFETT